MPDSLPDMTDSIPLVRQILRHLIETVSVMGRRAAFAPNQSARRQSAR
jgi:hypothetical protein